MQLPPPLACRACVRIAIFVLAFLVPVRLMAAGGPAPDGAAGADRSWALVATVFMLLMAVPGLALYYGGRARSMGAAAMFARCVIVAALVSLLWAAFGYSLAFTTGPGHLDALVGGGSRAFLAGLDPGHSSPLPETVAACYELGLALLGPAILVGAFAERIRSSSLLLFLLVWFSFSYLPICHMVWGGGILSRLGFLDFAGGAVVHANAGVAALAAAALLGPRPGFDATAVRPRHLPSALVGASILWAGWLFMNAGGTPRRGGEPGSALLVTQLAAAAGLLVWAVLDRLSGKRPTGVGMVAGALSGLVAATPCAGTGGPLGGLLLGIVSAFVCHLGSMITRKILHWDDSLDVFAVHGLGGAVGTLLLGVCASESLGGQGIPGGRDIIAQTFRQATALLAVVGWSGIVSLIGLVIASGVFGLGLTSARATDALRPAEAASAGESDVTLH